MIDLILRVKFEAKGLSASLIILFLINNELKLISFNEKDDDNKAKMDSYKDIEDCIRYNTCGICKISIRLWSRTNETKPVNENNE